MTPGCWGNGLAVKVLAGQTGRKSQLPKGAL